MYVSSYLTYYFCFGGITLGIGSQLKKARLQTMLSQNEVSEQLKVSRQAISRWENNRGYPDIDNLILLCSIYNKPLDFFLNPDPILRKRLANKQPLIKQKSHLFEVLNSKLEGNFLETKQIKRYTQELKNDLYHSKATNQYNLKLLLIIILVSHLGALFPFLECFLPFLILRLSKLAKSEYKLLIFVIFTIVFASIIKMIICYAGLI
jgi:transcriptional regulator with XRE-family HTH domain